jgi:hypothetical protein
MSGEPPYKSARRLSSTAATDADATTAANVQGDGSKAKTGVRQHKLANWI